MGETEMYIENHADKKAGAPAVMRVSLNSCRSKGADDYLHVAGDWGLLLMG
jgi:hypothetical protein